MIIINATTQSVITLENDIFSIFMYVHERTQAVCRIPNALISKICAPVASLSNAFIAKAIYVLRYKKKDHIQ